MSPDKAIERLLEALTQPEKASGVAYLSEAPMPAGTRLEFPRLAIEVERAAWAAFVDRQPHADWGHACRYLLIDDEGGRTRSFEAQFPPFRPGSPWKWRVVYQVPADQE